MWIPQFSKKISIIFIILFSVKLNLLSELCANQNIYCTEVPHSERKFVLHEPYLFEDVYNTLADVVGQRN